MGEVAIVVGGSAEYVAKCGRERRADAEADDQES